MTNALSVLSGGLVRLRRQGALPAIGALIIFLIIYTIVNPELFTRFQLQTAANLAAPLALVGLAQLLVVIVGGIDLSVGALMSLTNVIFAVMIPHGVVIALLLTIGVAILCGAFNGALVTFGRLPSIAVTLASLFIFGALAHLVLDRPGAAIPQSVTDVASGELAPYVPMGAVWLLVVAVSMWLLLTKTSGGRQIYGVGSAAAGLKAVGQSPNLMRLFAFIGAAMITAVAAILFAGSTATGSPRSGDPYLLNSIAAVALGGASFAGGSGSVAGTLSAATIIALIGNFLFFAGVESYWEYVITAVIIVAIIGIPALAQNVRSWLKARSA